MLRLSAGLVARCGTGACRVTTVRSHGRRQAHLVSQAHTGPPRPPAHPAFSTPPATEPSAAYVHLPFCKRKCRYCDFPVVALGKRAGDTSSKNSTTPVVMTEYMEALQREMRAMQRQNTDPLRSVYFGGGTPSLVPPAELAQLLHLIHERFGLAPDAEISLEADPGTFDVARLRDYMAAGVNRVSLGVQAFQDDLLRLCGRSHGVVDVHAAIADVRAAGFEAWSLDLISGLPQLTRPVWQHSLAAAVAAGPPHISVYDLQVEPGTPFAQLYAPGQSPLPSDDVAATLLRDAHAMLTDAGYEHYEVSSYAQPGRRGKHNSVYWAGGPFYAFGMGAASYLKGHRFTRPRKLQAYLSWVAALPDSWPVPENKETPRDRLLDAIMLRCRLADGVDMEVLRHVAGDAAHEPGLLRGLARHVDSGLAWIEEGAGPGVTRFGLSVPDGFLLSNHVISDLFAAIDDE